MRCGVGSDRHVPCALQNVAALQNGPESACQHPDNFVQDKGATDLNYLLYSGNVETMPKREFGGLDICEADGKCIFGLAKHFLRGVDRDPITVIEGFTRPASDT